MVSVPIDIQNRVTPEPLTRQRLDAPQNRSGEMIGRAVAGFGQDVQQFAEEQDRINAVYDTAAVKDADARAQARLSEIRGTVLSARGQDAVAAKAQARSQIQELRKEFVTSMANPRQQRMLGDAFSRLEVQEFETYDNHERKEIERFRIDGAKSRQANSLARAVDLAGVNDKAAEEAIAEARVENRTLYAGADGATLGRADSELTSSYRIQVAQKIADGAGDTAGDALAAKAYIDKHAAEILPDDESRIRKAIRGDVDDAIGEAAYGEVLGMTHGVERTPDSQTAAKDGEQVAQFNSDPLRGKGRTSSGFTDTRDGGRRQHNAEDLAAPAGTPVYAPMSGKVEKVWYDPAGGNSVLVRHPDGRVTGYAHLRNVSVSAGDNVDANTVLGGVGNTGSASRGNHLHFTVRNAAGNKVDPAKQNWREQGILAPSTDRADVGDLYQKALIVAQRRNLSPRQTRELLARVDSDVARSDRLKARSEEDARDGVYTILDNLGDKFTDVSQIPLSLRQRLAPGVLSTLRNVADSNAKGDSIPSGSETYLDLLEMSGNPSTQQAFINADLYKVRGQMSRGDWLQLRKDQIEMKNKGGTSSDLAADWSRVSTMVGRYAPQTPALMDRRNPAGRSQRVQIETRVREQVSALQAKKGAKLTEDELAAVTRSVITSAVLAPKNGATVTSARTATSVPGVPQAETQKILEAWRLRYGSRPITAGDVTRLYLQGGGTLSR